MRAPRASGSSRRRAGSQPAQAGHPTARYARSRCSRSRCENRVINLELATAAGSSRFFSLALRAGAAMPQDDFAARDDGACLLVRGRWRWLWRALGESDHSCLRLLDEVEAVAERVGE